MEKQNGFENLLRTIAENFHNLENIQEWNYA